MPLSLQNLIGLIPLALLLGEVTEDLAIRLGETIGGLLNATFGELCVGGCQGAGHAVGTNTAINAGQPFRALRLQFATIISCC
jgi:hypothetical protein